MSLPPRKYFQPEIVGRIAAAGLRVRQPMEGPISGKHRSPLHGVSPEFADYREYAPGDDLRDLDWRAYGRSDRFYIKRYEEESNLRGHLVVDASRSMAYGRELGDARGARRSRSAGGAESASSATSKRALSKWDCAATLAVSLAALLLRQRDAVGLTTFDISETIRLPASASASQLHKLENLLESIAPTGRTDLGGALAALADQLPRRSLVFVVSDLLAPLQPLYDALGRLQHAGHELIVFQVLDPDELELPFDDAVIFRDIEGAEELFAQPWAFRRAYQRAMEEFLADVRRHCEFCGIDHLLVRTTDDLGAVVPPFLRERQSRSGRGRRGRMRQLGGPAQSGPPSPQREHPSPQREQGEDSPADAARSRGEAE